MTANADEIRAQQLEQIRKGAAEWPESPAGKALEIEVRGRRNKRTSSVALRHVSDIVA